MRSWFFLGVYGLKVGREIADIKMLGVDQLGTFTNSFVVSCGAKVEGQTRYPEARR